jgi:hypothetical protein
MKKDLKAWAIKLRGRSLYQNSYNIPYLYPTRVEAELEMERIADRKNRNPHNINVSTELVRVKVRVEVIE